MRKRKHKLKRILVISYNSKLSCYSLSWKYMSKRSKRRVIFLGSKNDALKIAKQLVQYGFAENIIVK